MFLLESLFEAFNRSVPSWLSSFLRSNLYDSGGDGSLYLGRGAADSFVDLLSKSAKTKGKEEDWETVFNPNSFNESTFVMVDAADIPIGEEEFKSYLKSIGRSIWFFKIGNYVYSFTVGPGGGYNLVNGAAPVRGESSVSTFNTAAKSTNGLISLMKDADEIGYFSDVNGSFTAGMYSGISSGSKSEYRRVRSLYLDTKKLLMETDNDFSEYCVGLVDYLSGMSSTLDECVKSLSNLHFDDTDCTRGNYSWANYMSKEFPGLHDIDIKKLSGLAQEEAEGGQRRTEIEEEKLVKASCQYIYVLYCLCMVRKFYNENDFPRNYIDIPDMEHGLGLKLFDGSTTKYDAIRKSSDRSDLAYTVKFGESVSKVLKSIEEFDKEIQELYSSIVAYVGDIDDIIATCKKINKPYIFVQTIKGNILYVSDRLYIDAEDLMTRIQKAFSDIPRISDRIRLALKNVDDVNNKYIEEHGINIDAGVVNDSSEVM